MKRAIRMKRPYEYAEKMTNDRQDAGMEARGQNKWI